MSTELATLDAARHELSDETIAEIREIFHGDVVTPDDSTYDDTRVVQNGMFDRRPGLIVQCNGVADVVDCVTMARERDLLLSVRGGGHSIAGTCIADDALMLDLSQMSGVWVDASGRRVRVQGGAIWGDVDRETQLHGLAVPGGVISTTGVAGLTLGGGIGWLHRKYGLACDVLRAAEVVLPDRRVVRASADEHPELFWALRGGGGNFGVVTTFEFDAYPVGPTVWNSAVMYPLDAADGLIERWKDWATNIPDEITTRVMCWTMPEAPPLPPAVHNRDVIILAALHSGAPDDGERLCAPLARTGEPLADDRATREDSGRVIALLVRGVSVLSMSGRSASLRGVRWLRLLAKAGPVVAEPDRGMVRSCDGVPTLAVDRTNVGSVTCSAN